jgi:hypothetical protein
MSYILSTLVFDVFDMLPGYRQSWFNKFKQGVIRYGTARAEDALRNGHPY